MRRQGARPIAMALLALLVAAIYAQGLRFGFVEFDDPLYVSENAVVLRGLTASGIRWALATFETGNWHPLTWVSLMLDVSIAGASPAMLHATNVALHLLATWLLLGWLSGATGRPWRSAMVAGLFAVHPLHVESVAWIAERKDVLSAALAFASLLAWLGWARRRKRGAYALSLVLFALGLASKPMLVTLPLLLLLLDVWPLDRYRSPATEGEPGPARLRLLEKLPFFVLAAASAAVTLVAQRAGGAMGSLEAYPLAGRAATAAISLGAYLGSAFAPIGLSPIYSYPRGGVDPVATAAALALLAALGTLAYARRRERPYLLFGLAWFVVSLVPVLGIVQVGIQARADRYTYLPLVGIFVAAVWLASDLFRVSGWAGRHPRLAQGLFGAAAAMLMIALSALAHRQAGFWRDGVTLFSHAVDVDPASARAHHALGLALTRAARRADGVAALHEAVRLDPADPELRADLGAAWAEQSRWEAAANEMREAVRLRPDHAGWRATLGRIHLARGDLPSALEQFRAILTLDPGNAEALGVLERASRHRTEPLPRE